MKLQIFAADIDAAAIGSAEEVISFAPFQACLLGRLALDAATRQGVASDPVADKPGLEAPFLLIESAGGQVKFSHTLAATEVVAFQWSRWLDEAVE